MCSNSCRYYLKVVSHSKCYVCRGLFNHVYNDVFDGININYIVWTIFKPTKKQSMKVQSVHVMNAFIIQNKRSSLQSIRKEV